MTTPYALPPPIVTIVHGFTPEQMQQAFKDGAASRDDILKHALVALSLYVQEDDVIESMEGNEYWVEIKRSAESVIEEIKKVITP